MDFQIIIDNTKEELEKKISRFREEMLKIRSGRLSPALLEDIECDCFGSFLPLKQLGAITSSGTREILVQLWDKSYVEAVVRAVEKAGLNLSLRIDGQKIYFTVPPLTSEIREQMVKLLNKTKEEFFQGLRHLRDSAWKKLQSPEIREDDKFKGRDKLDETVKGFVLRLDGEPDVLHQTLVL